MQTFLLTWNPDKWPWDTFDADYDRARKQGFLDDSWSSGRSHRLRRGDRVFLLRQAREPRGILASGVVTSDEPYEGKHYSEPDGTTIYVDTRFDVILHPAREPILPRARLDEPPLDAVHWNTQSSGITIPPEAAAALENIWHDFLLSRGYSPIRFAEEIAAPERFWEGALRRTTINAYERDPAARKVCIAHFGSACQACGFDFTARFGELGVGYIHVHHTRPLSEARRGYAVDPIKDLIPVCPNCHAMLHQRTPPLSIGELRKHIRDRTNDVARPRLVRSMKITEYIAHHQMQPINTASLVRPVFVPSSLAQKFTLDDDAEYFADSTKTRWAGLCRKCNFFAVWKSEAITTGELNKSYSTLRSF